MKRKESKVVLGKSTVGCAHNSGPAKNAFVLVHNSKKHAREEGGRLGTSRYFPEENLHLLDTICTSLGGERFLWVWKFFD